MESEFYLNQKTKMNNNLEQLSNLEEICSFIIGKKPNYVRIRHYPSCVSIFDEPTTDTDNNIIQTSELNNNEKNKLLRYLKDKPHISGTFTEYGIRDIYVRVSNTTNSNVKGNKPENSRLFFRRELYMIESMSLHKLIELEINPEENNFDIPSCSSSIYVFEVYKLCEEEEFPYIVNYHHNTNYFATTYTTVEQNGELKICFTNIQNNKTQNNNSDSVKSTESFIDINKDLKIIDVTTNELVLEVSHFIKDVTALKRKTKIN
jgi:hypothetical protein